MTNSLHMSSVAGIAVWKLFKHMVYYDFPLDIVNNLFLTLLFFLFITHSVVLLEMHWVDALNWVL